MSRTPALAARDVRDAARILRRIAAEIEAGRLDITPSQLHRLQGSIAALEAITEQEAQHDRANRRPVPPTAPRT